MRIPIFLLVAIALAAQDPQPGAEQKKTPAHAAPKNLKLLKPEEVRPMMGAFRVALGAQCTTCHVQGDFASDEKPEKQTARMMIAMTRDINSKFSDGEQHVSCYTCHRGEEHPKMKADAAPAPAAN